MVKFSVWSNGMQVKTLRYANPDNAMASFAKFCRKNGFVSPIPAGDAFGGVVYGNSRGEVLELHASLA